MNTQAVLEKQVQELTDHERIFRREYGGLPRAGAGMARATVIAEKEVVPVQPREIGPQVQIDELLDPPGEVYSLGSRAGRIVGASIALAIVVAPGFVFHNPGTIFNLGAVLLAMLFGLPLVLLFAAVEALETPYQVRIAPSGEITFVSVLGAIEIHANEILRIVRRERWSNRALLGVRVEHWSGTVTLNGHEEIFARLTALRPTAQVKTEVYDDTD